MAEYTEDQLYDMSDEELEAAFKEAREAMDSEEEAPAEAEVEEEVVEENDEEEFEAEEDEPENEDENLEQPDVSEDSDDDASADEEAEEDSENDSEEEEGEPDEELDSDEDQSDEDDEDEDTEAQPVPEYKFKANGKEYTFSQEEIMERFPDMFGKAMDYTKKMQTLKPWRKTIDALETAEISHADVSLMIDVLQGDKDAIAEVVKRTGVDALELDADERSYTAKDYGRDAEALAIKDVVDSIKDDAEYQTTHKILSSTWDDESWKKMSQDPKMIQALHMDVKSGMYDKLAPMAEKMKLFDDGRKSDLEYYGEAARQYFAKQQADEDAKAQEEAAEAERVKSELVRMEKAKAAKAKRQVTKVASKKRKAAATTKKAAGAKKVTDFLDADDDESYYEWKRRTEDEN